MASWEAWEACGGWRSRRHGKRGRGGGCVVAARRGRRDPLQALAAQVDFESNS